MPKIRIIHQCSFNRNNSIKLYFTKKTVVSIASKTVKSFTGDKKKPVYLINKEWLATFVKFESTNQHQ